MSYGDIGLLDYDWENFESSRDFGEDDAVGDPPDSGGGSSFGGGGQPGGGPYPSPPPGGLPAPEPPPDDPPPDDDSTGASASSDPGPGVLSGYAKCLARVRSAAESLGIPTPGGKMPRAIGAASEALAARLDLVLLNANEAERLGEELLGRLRPGAGTTQARAAALSSFIERARLVRAAALDLHREAKGLAVQMEGR